MKREFKITSKAEEEFISRHHINRVNEEYAKKTIFFSLYEDTIPNDDKKFEYVENNFSSKMSDMMFFDVLAVNEEDNDLSFIIFSDSENDPEHKYLRSRLQGTVELIKQAVKSPANRLDYFDVFKDCSDQLTDDLDKYFNDQMNINIYVYDLAESQKADEDIQKYIDENFDESDIAIDVISRAQYINEVKSVDSSVLGGMNQGADITFDFYYDDPDRSQTPENAHRNFIHYKTKESDNYIFSMKSTSLIKAYDSFRGTLLEKNVRYGLKREGSAVNKAIQETASVFPDQFWILNNGMTIVAEDMNEPDETNKKITLKRFNIVNGAQTITNLWELHNSKKGKEINFDEILIPVKVVVPAKGSAPEDYQEIVNKVVQAANTQKAVKPRDLVSNNPEMKKLKEIFKDNDYILRIKRGDDNFTDKVDEEDIIKSGRDVRGTIDNATLGQEILSTIFLKPSLALQKKAKLFNAEFYPFIFNNSLVSAENDLAAHIVYEWTDKLIDSFLKDFKFESLKMTLGSNILDDNNADDSNEWKKAKELFNQTRMWINAALYYALYRYIYLGKKWEHGIQTIDSNEIENLRAKQTFNNEANIYMFTLEDAYTLAETITKEVKPDIDELLRQAIIIIYNTYTKMNSDNASLLSNAAFSFRPKAFEAFLYEWLNSYQLNPLFERFVDWAYPAELE